MTLPAMQLVGQTNICPPKCLGLYAYVEIEAQFKGYQFMLISGLSIFVLVTSAAVRVIGVRVRRPFKYLVLWVGDTWG